MEVLSNLPGVLQELKLEYMSLPELIEGGIELTPRWLTQLVVNTLGQPALDPPSGGVCNIVTTPITDAAGDGLTALVLLDRLPPELISPQFMEYFGHQPFQFKQVLYPNMLRLIAELPEDAYGDMLSALGTIESYIAGPNSGLELIWDIVGPDFGRHISIMKLIRTNPQFLLNHLDELPVIVNMVFMAVEVGNDAVAKTLALRLITPENSIIRRQLGYVTTEQQQAVALQQLPHIYAFIQPELQRRGIDVE